jgi:hypothetical protein
MTATRATIVAQLSTITGVTPAIRAFPLPPSTPRAGDAWPMKSGLERGHGDSWATEWTIVICLGSDPVEASANFDVLVPAVLDVLDPILWPDEVRVATYEVQNVTVALTAQIRCAAE